MVSRPNHFDRKINQAPKGAIVLAGGLGTRLKGVLPDRPKVLAPSAGRPFLDYLLSYLAEQDVSEVVLSIGYLGDQVRAFAGSGGKWGLQIRYCPEQMPLGTGGGLRLASDMVSEQSFFALNGDTLFRINLNALWIYHQSLDVKATIALRHTSKSDGASRGCVSLLQRGLESGGRIVAFDEKPVGDPIPDRSQTESSLVNGGIYVLQKEALASITPGEGASVEREVFPRLASDGQLGGHIQDGYFADIGTPESLAAFEKDLITGRQ